MAGSLIFRYRPGLSLLHRTDTRVKLVAMIALSLAMVRISPYKLILITPLLLTGLMMLRDRTTGRTLSPVLLIMPLIIFLGNFLSLRYSVGTATLTAMVTACLRMGAFISILILAQLFIASTDPLGISPALYVFFKHIPLIPARDLSTRMGLSLSLIPLILDEMNEIRDAMVSRCGWNPRRPLRNLFHMGLPLLEGILQKAESLSDAMEARCYTEDATDPEIQGGRFVLIPLLFLVILLILLFLPQFLPIEALFFPCIYRFY